MVNSVAACSIHSRGINSDSAESVNKRRREYTSTIIAFPYCCSRWASTLSVQCKMIQYGKFDIVSGRPSEPQLTRVFETAEEGREALDFDNVLILYRLLLLAYI
jgi:hypothetical protein